MNERPVPISPVEGGASLMVAWRLPDRHALVVGGGAVAAGRVRSVLEADARVTVVSPELRVELRTRAARREITWRARAFVPSDLDGVDMVLTAVDDATASRRIATLARARRIPVNVADVPSLCDFWFAAVHRDGPLQVAVSTNGRGPGLAARIRAHVRHRLPAGISGAIRGFSVLREAVRQVDADPASADRRMSWLSSIGKEWSFDTLRRLDGPQARALAQAYLRGAPPPPDPAAPVPPSPPAHLGRGTPSTGRRRGRVILVGAGPGDPELLTVAAQRALETADVIVADRLISKEILALARGELRIARKLRGRSHEAQREIEGWVIASADRGQRVVRLKQGDPFVYGRAGEELECYTRAGLAVDVIPGISSALAAPLLAGIPLTLRGVADRFVVSTGQGADGKRVDVPPFDPDATLVLLMAVGRAAELARSLRWASYPRDQPVAIIERASQPEERITTTVIAELSATIERRQVQPPAVIVIGRVVELPASLQASPRRAAGGTS